MNKEVLLFLFQPRGTNCTDCVWTSHWSALCTLKDCAILPSLQNTNSLTIYSEGLLLKHIYTYLLTKWSQTN